MMNPINVYEDVYEMTNRRFPKYISFDEEFIYSSHYHKGESILNNCAESTIKNKWYKKKKWSKRRSRDKQKL